MRGFLTLLCVFGLFLGAANASETNLLSLNWENKDLVEREGYLYNTSRDGFFKVSGFELPRHQACYLAMELEFAEPLFRPALFELFWATTPGAFAEQRKATFLIDHRSSQQRTLYVIPLCKLYGFSGNLDIPLRQTNIVGLRLDYPMNREIGLKFHSARLLSKDALVNLAGQSATSSIFIEPYERLSGASFRSLDVIVPKLYFAFEDGAHRLAQDIGFLIFWLALIASMIGVLVWRMVTKPAR